MIKKKKYWVQIIDLKKIKKINNFFKRRKRYKYRFVPLNTIKNIKLKKLTQALNRIYTAENQENEYYFGDWKKNTFLLGKIVKKKISMKKRKSNVVNYYNIINNRKKNKRSIYIKVSGRLSGGNKASEFFIGNIRTKTIREGRLDYYEKPIQTKVGKIGLKIIIHNG